MLPVFWDEVLLALELPGSGAEDGTEDGTEDGLTESVSEDDSAGLAAEDGTQITDCSEAGAMACCKSDSPLASLPGPAGAKTGWPLPVSDVRAIEPPVTSTAPNTTKIIFNPVFICITTLSHKRGVLTGLAKSNPRLYSDKKELNSGFENLFLKRVPLRKVQSSFVISRIDRNLFQG